MFTIPILKNIYCTDILENKRSDILKYVNWLETLVKHRPSLSLQYLLARQKTDVRYAHVSFIYLFLSWDKYNNNKIIIC